MKTTWEGRGAGRGNLVRDAVQLHFISRRAAPRGQMVMTAIASPYGRGRLIDLSIAHISHWRPAPCGDNTHGWDFTLLLSSFLGQKRNDPGLHMHLASGSGRCECLYSRQRVGVSWGFNCLTLWRAEYTRAVSSSAELSATTASGQVPTCARPAPEAVWVICGQKF